MSPKQWLPALLFFTAIPNQNVFSNDDHAFVEDGGTNAIDVLSNDDSATNPATLYFVDPPSNGYVELNPDGTIIYNHYAGTGSDSFSYRVADYSGNYSDTFNVAMQVGSGTTTTQNSNDVYVADGGLTTIELVSPGSSTLDASTLYVDTLPSRGYLVALYDGAVEYHHYQGTGSDNFSYAVADNNGNYQQPITVSVNIGDAGSSSSSSNDGANPVSRRPDQPITPQPPPAVPAVPAVPAAPTTANQSWWQPGASDNLKWQLQLQGDIRIISGVDVYAADYTASQASINAAKNTGAKLKCYISAGSAENWRSDFYDFPVYTIGNEYQNWPGEWWLDTSNIDAIAPIMRARMDVCREKGFDIIDADNVNGYENNTGFNLSRGDSVNYIRWLANESHTRGMAFSLKNSESLIDDVIDAVDMLQTESCFVYGNCENAAKMIAADKPVFAVEYQENISESEFSQACSLAANYGFSMIYRNLSLSPEGRYLSCN